MVCKILRSLAQDNLYSEDKKPLKVLFVWGFVQEIVVFLGRMNWGSFKMGII